MKTHSGIGKSTPVQRPILCVNTGSSSLKCALFLSDGTEEIRVAEGAVEGIGVRGSRLWIRSAKGETLMQHQTDFAAHRPAVDAIFAGLEELEFPEPFAVGHRIVHGGPHLTAPARVDAQLLDTLRQLIAFAPLHLPVSIEGIEAVAGRFPELPQVACFDTAFHQRMPESAKRLPLPRRFWDEGLRRYGFHGLSYEHILGMLGGQGRIIIAHLGNGASMAAVRDGLPIDTTMGFTPAGGLMMGTRSGDLDPGVLIYLMNEHGYGPAQIDRLVNYESGLLGVSGVSSDMKTLLERRKDDPNAAQAVDIFCYQARKHIGALASALGGIDTLVFTGGIGERAAPVRHKICQDLNYLGIGLDEKKNEKHADVISALGSVCTVRVIPAQEDLVIARHTRKTVFETI